MENLKEYYKAFAALPQVAEEVGAEEAAGQLAERVAGMVDDDVLEERVRAIRQKHGLMQEDARTAFWILQVYYWDNFVRRRPIFGRIARTLASIMRLKYPKPVVETPDEVIVESPWGVDCPIVRGFGGDLEKARPLCEACFRHKVVIEPDQLALMQKASPTLRLELREFRESPEQNCTYALVSRQS